MSQLPELVVFDWNGTILNDVAASAAAMQKILDKLGDNRTATIELYRQHCSVPIRKTYESLGYSHLSNSEIIEINAEWQKAYKNVEHKQILQDGIQSTINWLEDNRIPKVILSNHMKPSIEKNLSRLNLNFDNILARNEQHHMITVGKSQLLADYLETQSLDPSKAVIIGDTAEEFDIANSLGLQSIIITNGSVAKDRLLHIPENQRTDTSDLLKKLQGLFT